MREYELVMVLSPEMDEAGVNEAVSRVTRYVTDRGGSVASEENWGLRRLAYPIQNFHEGNYVLTELNMEPAQASGLESTLRLTPGLLRHLLIKQES